jgi:hypothetical protein
MTTSGVLAIKHFALLPKGFVAVSLIFAVKAGAYPSAVSYRAPLKG